MSQPEEDIEHQISGRVESEEHEGCEEVNTRVADQANPTGDSEKEKAKEIIDVVHDAEYGNKRKEVATISDM